MILSHFIDKNAKFEEHGIHSPLEPGTMLSHGNTRKLQSNKGNRNKSVTMINYNDKGKHRLF